MSAVVREVIRRGSRRRGVVIGSGAVLLLAVVIASLFLGEYQLTLPQMVATLLGDAPEQKADFFINRRRLPRAVVAALVGAALAMSGTVFQRLTANPLASPDIVGVTGGASAGGAFVMLILGGSLSQVAIGAVIGALLAAGFIALVASRTGSFSARVVLVGVAVASMSGAFVSYLLTQVFVARAVTAQTWLVGTLQGRGWSDLAPLLIAFLIAAPLLIWTSADARLSDLGEDTARAAGVNLGRTRLLRALAATLLAAGAVAITGPISFVALAAPHIANALVRGTSVIASALVGAVLLVVSDQIAQHAFGLPIPVGVVTVTIGGAFFLWILMRQRSRRG